MPRMRALLPIAQTPARTGIMGASLGGLVATYAAFRHPEVFGFCAAQSPAYWWKEEAMLNALRASRHKIIVFLGAVLTMHLGPQEVLLNIEVRFKQGLQAEDIHAAIHRIEEHIVAGPAGAQHAPRL